MYSFYHSPYGLILVWYLHFSAQLHHINSSDKVLQENWIPFWISKTVPQLTLSVSVLSRSRLCKLTQQSLNISNKHCSYTCSHGALSWTLLHTVRLFSKISKLHTVSVICCLLTSRLCSCLASVSSDLCLPMSHLILVADTAPQSCHCLGETA